MIHAGDHEEAEVVRNAAASRLLGGGVVVEWAAVLPGGLAARDLISLPAGLRVFVHQQWFGDSPQGG
jgi:hypothetical protein